MTLNKNIEKTAKELYSLDINYQKRKELIKTCYTCFGKIYSFPKILNKSIKEAKDNNLSGKKAYSLIEKRFQDYNKDIIQSMTDQKESVLEHRLI
jgi:hypothetical protein